MERGGARRFDQAAKTPLVNQIDHIPFAGQAKALSTLLPGSEYRVYILRLLIQLVQLLGLPEMLGGAQVAAMGHDLGAGRLVYQRVQPIHRPANPLG